MKTENKNFSSRQKSGPYASLDEFVQSKLERAKRTLSHVDLSKITGYKAEKNN